MTYFNGDQCQKGNITDVRSTHVRSTHVEIICDKSAKKLVIQSVKMNDCETVVTVKSRLACATFQEEHNRHHANRRHHVAVGFFVGGAVLVLCSIAACVTCCCIKRRRCRRARRAQHTQINEEEMNLVVQPQIVASLFNPEAMQPNVQMYPMQFVAPNVNTQVPQVEADAELARRLQDHFNREQM
jgi:hypothetical protein